MLRAIDSESRLGRDNSRSFFFFLVPPGDSPRRTRYQHPAIVLAEGFSSLGLPFASNIDHWAPGPSMQPLFQADPAVDPYSCSAVFFTSDWLEEGLPIPPGLFEGANRPITIYLDHEDGSKIHSLRPDLPAFDLVLRAHYVRNSQYRPNFRPWAFGLSNRLIEATNPYLPHADRIAQLLVSYRHMRYPHGVRRYMDEAFLERLGSRLHVERYIEDPAQERDLQDDHFWRITGRRHSKRYYEMLRASTASACFGGYFIPPWPRDERNVLSRFLKRAILRLNLRTHVITQYDSWRFWESLAAGCATFHLDLNEHGVVLPEMPLNWTHYIGLDPDRLDRDIDRITVQAGLLEAVGAAGRTWSIATYGPAPTAKRFLAMIGWKAAAVL